jgi:hypothetical protein
MGLGDWFRKRLGAKDDARWREQLESPQLTQEQFTEIYAEATASLPAVEEVSVSEDFTLEIQTGSTELKLDLSEWYEGLPKDPAERTAQLQGFLRLVQQRAPGAVRPELRDVVPVIKGRSFFEELAPGEGIHHEPLVADLFVAYAFDSPESFRFMTGEEGGALGISFPELRQIAEDNLRDKLPEVELTSSGPVHILSAGGNFEASLLLLGDLWEQMAEQVKGSLVACAPARDLLYFTGLEERGGVRSLAQYVEKMYPQAMHPVSKALLLREEKAWVPFSLRRAGLPA